MREGVDAISEVPADRWDIAAYYDADPDTPGKMNTRFGGFISQVDGFDAHFFGISPREARTMDPQQRLLLEVAWEALENAGHRGRAAIAGSATGVFVGISGDDYFQLRARTAARRSSTPISVGHRAQRRVRPAVLLLGLHGPSMAIDTACSSSLVAMHLAVPEPARAASAAWRSPAAST